MSQALREEEHRNILIFFHVVAWSCLRSKDKKIQRPARATITGLGTWRKRIPTPHVLSHNGPQKIKMSSQLTSRGGPDLEFVLRDSLQQKFPDTGFWNLILVSCRWDNRTLSTSELRPGYEPLSGVWNTAELRGLEGKEKEKDLIGTRRSRCVIGEGLKNFQLAKSITKSNVASCIALIEEVTGRR